MSGFDKLDKPSTAGRIPPSVEAVVLAAIILDGIKGGVGKSWLARLFAHYLNTRKVIWQGIDGDPNNGHLARFHPSQTIRSDATTNAAFDVILDEMCVRPQTTLLIDLPAGVGARLDLQKGALEAASEASGMRLIRVFVMEATYDSVNQFAATSAFFEPSDTLVILNNRSGGRDAFEFWKGTNTRNAFLQSGGTEGFVGRLDENTVGHFEVNATNTKLSFEAALATDNLPGAVRYRLVTYLFDTMAEFERIFRKMELI